MRWPPCSAFLPRVNPALHIAVLGDEVDITQLLANYLRGHGYRVTPMHNGRSLVALMPVDPPALVLLEPGCPAKTASRSHASWANTGAAAWSS
jgi:DNA-binding response OmpR family regulator